MRYKEDQVQSALTKKKNERGKYFYSNAGIGKCAWSRQKGGEGTLSRPEKKKLVSTGL